MSAIADRLLAPVAWSVPVLVVTQAAMIGQTLYGPGSLIGLHGSTGNLTFLLAAVTLVLAWSARRSGVALLLTFATVLLLFAQIGSGYLGHRYGMSVASSAHITLGVLVTAVSAAAAMRCSTERSSGPGRHLPRSLRRTVRRCERRASEDRATLQAVVRERGRCGEPIVGRPGGALRRDAAAQLTVAQVRQRLRLIREPLQQVQERHEFVGLRLEDSTSPSEVSQPLPVPVQPLTETVAVDPE
jgi:hypothetical protein